MSGSDHTAYVAITMNADDAPALTPEQEAELGARMAERVIVRGKCYGWRACRTREPEVTIEQYTAITGPCNGPWFCLWRALTQHRQVRQPQWVRHLAARLLAAWRFSIATLNASTSVAALRALIRKDTTMTQLSQVDECRIAKLANIKRWHAYRAELIQARKDASAHYKEAIRKATTEIDRLMGEEDSQFAFDFNVPPPVTLLKLPPEASAPTPHESDSTEGAPPEGAPS